MNKQKKVIIAVLTLVVTMMVGYALFSEALTINGTATAKGDFNITTTCTPGIQKDFPMEGYNYFFSGSPSITKDNHYKNDSCTVNGNEVTFNAELTQPLAARNYTVKLTNSGSIPASFNPGMESEEGSIQWSIERCEGNFEDDTFSNCTNNLDYNSIMDFELLGFEDANGNISVNLKSSDEISKYIDTENALIILQPGESMYMRFSAEWREETDSGQGLDNGNNKTYYKDTLKVQFTFSQAPSK